MDDKTRELLMKAADDWASAARLLPGYRNPDLLALKERCHAHVRAIRAALAQPEPQCPHEHEPRGCYRVRCQLGEACVVTSAVLAAAPTPPASEPVISIHRAHLTPQPEPWCREVLAYSPNNPGDSPEQRVKLYAHPAPNQQEADAIAAAKREAAAYKWAYEYLQSRMRSIGRDGWAQDCDGEIEARMKGEQT